MNCFINTDQRISDMVKPSGTGTERFHMKLRNRQHKRRVVGTTAKGNTGAP